MKLILFLALVVKIHAKCCDSRDVADKFLLSTSDDLQVQAPTLNLVPLVSEEEAFLAYSKEQGFILRKDFIEIVNFIARVKEAKVNEVFTTKDEEMLRKMGFVPLLSISFPCLVFNPSDCSQRNWDRVFKTYELEMPFYQALNVLFHLYPVDFMSRKEFLEFHRAIDFLQGGESQSFERIEFLCDIFSSDESFNIKNSELRYLSTKANFTADIFSLDFVALIKVFGDRSFTIVQEILEYYSDKTEARLKKIEIMNLPVYETEEGMQLNFHFYEMLRLHSTTLESFSINSDNSACDSKIWFPNLTELTIKRSLRSCESFRFLLHSNYTVLESSEELTIVQGPDTKEYFKVCSESDNIKPLVHILHSNPSLEQLSFKSSLQIPSQELQQAVRTLKHLKHFRPEILQCNLYNFFHPENELESLGILHSDEFINWKSLGEDLPHLKTLFFMGFDLMHTNEFLHFLSNSNLQSISLPLLYVLDKERRIYNAFNNLESLLSIRLAIYNNSEMKYFFLHKRFVAVQIREVQICDNFNPAPSSILQHLPSGEGVKYLKIDSLPFEFCLFCPNDIQVLKSKFPALELLIVPCNTLLKPFPSVDFEIREKIGKVDDQFFSSVPHAFFE